jgi:hypothetical protein
MARWLRDAETGELFREDELDPSSYESVSDFQPLAAPEPEAPEYEFPSWMTTAGIGSSIPARAAASVLRSGSSLNEMLGDLASNIPGLEENLLQQNARQGRAIADALVEQSRRDNQIEPGSLTDIGGAIAGELIPSLGTLGAGMLAQAGKGFLAAAPAIMPAASKYTDLTDRGVSGPQAALGAAGSFALNSLLNRFDVGAALNPLSSPAKRIGQTALVGGLTNAAGTYGDALIDRQVGAPQTPEQFMTNLATSTAAGFGTGAGFGAMGALGRSLDTPVLDGQDADSMMAKMSQDAPQQPSTDAVQVGQAFNEYASDPFQNFMSMPEPFTGGDTIVPDSSVPVVKSRPAPDPLANITPDEAPLIQVEEGSRARTEEEIGRAREVLDVISPWQSSNTKQRRLEDIFMPVDSELAGYRQSLPEGTLLPEELQQSPIVKPFTQKGAVNKNLPVDEQNVVRSVLEAEPARKAKAETAEALARREEIRANNKGNVIGRGDELVIKSPEGTSSFPDPVKLITPEPQPVESGAIQVEEGYRTRTPEQIADANQTLRDASWDVFKREDGRPQQQPVSAPREQLPLFNRATEEAVATIKPEGTHPDDLRNTLGRRRATRKTKASPEPEDTQDIQSQYSKASATYDRLLREHAIQVVDVVEPLEASARKLEGAITEMRIAAKLGKNKGPKSLGFADKEQMESAYKNALYSLQELQKRVASEKSKAAEMLSMRDAAAVEWRALGDALKGKPKTRGVTSKEGGFVDLTDLANFFGLNKDKLEKQKLSGYQDWSDSNKRYSDKGWLNYGRRWEWMDTTRKNEPASAPFIDSQWAIPQDTHAIVWDADETLASYKRPDLTPKEKRGVNNYLQAARVLGGKDKGYKVSAETAATAGLNPKQIEAALSVKRWSDFFADLFENDSLAQAEHFAAMETLKAKKEGKPPEFSVAIAKRLQESKAKIAETFKGWRDSNYVPFDRYGEHYINVFDKEGNLIARQQFESNTDPAFRKAIAEYEELARQPGEYSGATVKTGRQAPKDLLQDFGVNQDILDILGTEGSGQPIEGFSRHLKKVVKLKAGQNEDLERAITDYTVGAARLLAFRRANRAAEMELSTTLAGDDKINLRNKLKEFQASLNNPKGEGLRLLNDYFNFAYIGGNARTPIADTIGFFQMQSMVLSKYLKGADPEKVELKTYGNLINYYFGRKLDDGMSAGIKQAQRKGIIPTDTFKTYLRERRGPSDAMKVMSTAKDAYFSLKALSERAVDAGAFMSGWEAWKRLPPETRKTVSQQQFAENMVREMRAVPSQYELPPNALFKTETGRLVSKFRLYQAKLGKTILETPMPGKLRGALRMFATVGLSGLPIVGKEAFTALRSFGVEPEDKLREAGIGSWAMYGPLSAATGVDWSGTAGFGETFPMQSDNPVNKFMLGMLGAPGEAGIRAKQYYERGQNSKAVAALPISNLLSNYLNQADWGNRGVVTMGGKAVIPRDEVQGVDRMKKLLGLQPLRVKEAMVMENRKKQEAAAARDNSYINQRLGEALGLGNTEEAQALQEWAADNGIKINKNSVNEYKAKIQGRDGKIPKKARAKIRRIEDIYGQAGRDQ